MSAKVRLLDEGTLDDLDEMLPRLHITGELGVQLVALARWAAKAHAYIRGLGHAHRTFEKGCNCERCTLLAEIASPGGTTDA